MFVVTMNARGVKLCEFMVTSMFQKKRSEAGKARELEKLESSQWEKDKESVFNSCAVFYVKVLGEISVDEARGVEICEYSVKDIPYKKNKTRGLLKIYSSGLTFVEEKSNALLINQTIEKVSFCCALPSNDRIFTYIARDSFTRQWVCHAFVTTKGVSADRVSHACACAFTACLQKKQKERSKVGLAPLGEPNTLAPQSGLEMRRVKSSGDVLDTGSKVPRQPTVKTSLRPLGGSRGDLLEESMEIREEAGRRVSKGLMKEVNGERGAPEILLTGPNQIGFESNFIALERTDLNRRSFPFQSKTPEPVPLDPWAPAFSPVKKVFQDPFDPFPLISPLQSGTANSQSPPVNLNPFSSLPNDWNVNKPGQNTTNPFL